MIYEYYLNICLACFLGFSLGLNLPTLSLAEIRKNTKPPLTTPEPSIPLEQLQQLTRAITVKVLLEDNWGSGFIIHQQGQVYTVVTNKHVLRPLQEQYRIQTVDGLIHHAWRTQEPVFPHHDLALLHFSSTQSAYLVATLGSTSFLREGEQVVAAGFPFVATAPDETAFKFTRGQISVLSKKALIDGYQLGYTNDIEKGMSGGPVLNLDGKVVAVNGMHAYPLWGDPYVYQDGEKPSPPLREIMERFSWAIPIDNVLQLAPQFSSSF